MKLEKDRLIAKVENLELSMYHQPVTERLHTSQEQSVSVGKNIKEDKNNISATKAASQTKAAAQQA